MASGTQTPTSPSPMRLVGAAGSAQRPTNGGSDNTPRLGVVTRLAVIGATLAAYCMTEDVPNVPPIVREGNIFTCAPDSPRFQDALARCSNAVGGLEESLALEEDDAENPTSDSLFLEQINAAVERSFNEFRSETDGIYNGKALTFAVNDLRTSILARLLSIAERNGYSHSDVRRLVKTSLV